MSPQTLGLHHVTAIAGDPQRNAEFYVETLGLRFVKRTVNHDDPGTYHFYFGDGVGTLGTNITFFPWTGTGHEGRFGAGQTKTTAYRVPADSVDYWQDRLESAAIDVTRDERFGETALRFADHDGIELELVAADDESTTDDGTAAATPWDESPVPSEHQLRGFHSVTVAVADVGPTAAVLTDVLGYDLEAEADGRYRYRSATGGSGSIVDLIETDVGQGHMGVGTVHHIAFTARSVEEQERWREAFADHGLRPSRVIDRKYFRSIYTREPGGILFEMATTGPGFTADEAPEELGSSLVLPDELEADREQIEAQLPPFDGPNADSSGN
ncbi:ring-cleaving dioxygenase [Natronorubrum sulfidifaciens]|uniref:Glyoxalase/bleomycin resistance protein/dioxygenase n=1 Tax=Natronorubrum sulfidifaciens JCM 14089 TaxID=1230460 RepID=L9W2L2_9EURY|nr:ring-cleaving dioxygenase [Natronorubrum sulfidifaciens]ELY43744.1 glyoxalase/bleomycin resistance protein/dioxygenase [Natronorubrum sulfidifaciens JCM 14089]